MNIKYLSSALNDMTWWRKYYRQTFPEGKTSAVRQLLAAEGLLKQNPGLGVKVEGRELRKLIIPNTPFMIVYRVKQNTVEIIRIWDMRQNPIYGFQES